jgi:hypothetical protein
MHTQHEAAVTRCVALLAPRLPAPASPALFPSLVPAPCSEPLKAQFSQLVHTSASCVVALGSGLG